METKRDELLMAMLGCDEYVLSLLIDNVGYDFNEVLDDWPPTKGLLCQIMKEVFLYGIGEIQKAVDCRVEKLEECSATGNLSKEGCAELKDLLELCPENDIEGYFTYFGSADVHCVNNASIYQKYVQDALDDFCENTGFEIKMEENDD